MTDFARLLRIMVDAAVEFIIVGGTAATAHGSSRLTLVLDVVYSRHPDNLDRLVTSLQELDPYIRGAPPGLPFKWEAETLARGLNFTLTTSAGDLDLLGEITGGGRISLGEVIPDLRLEELHTPYLGDGIDSLQQFIVLTAAPVDG